MAGSAKTPVMILHELATQRKWPPPEFQIVSQMMGTHVNRFDFVVQIPAVGVEGRGSGSSKQIGKHEAATSALMQLQELKIYNPSENPMTKFDVPIQHENCSFKSSLNCITELGTLCMENKIPAPIFLEISSVGPPHAKEFTWECKVASIRTEGKANTKKMAKQLAAKEMLDRIKDIVPELAAQTEELANRLTEKDSEAIKMYNTDFAKNVIPDKSAKVYDMPKMFHKMMREKELTYADFRELFVEVSEENFTKILNKLELKHEITPIEGGLPIITIELNTERPFCIAAIGGTIEEAKQRALEQAFKILNCFLSGGDSLENATECHEGEAIKSVSQQGGGSSTISHSEVNLLLKLGILNQVFPSLKILLMTFTLLFFFLDS